MKKDNITPPAATKTPSKAPQADVYAPEVQKTDTEKLDIGAGIGTPDPLLVFPPRRKIRGRPARRKQQKNEEPRPDTSDT